MGQNSSEDGIFCCVDLDSWEIGAKQGKKFGLVVYVSDDKVIHQQTSPREIRSGPGDCLRSRASTLVNTLQESIEVVRELKLERQQCLLDHLL